MQSHHTIFNDSDGFELAVHASKNASAKLFTVLLCMLRHGSFAGSMYSPSATAASSPLPMTKFSKLVQDVLGVRDEPGRLLDRLPLELEVILAKMRDGFSHSFDLAESPNTWFLPRCSHLGVFV